MLSCERDIARKINYDDVLNRLHSSVRVKHPYNLLILNSLVKILSNYFVSRYRPIKMLLEYVYMGSALKLIFALGPQNSLNGPGC